MSGAGSYDVSSKKVGGAGARGTRYADSAAGTKGEGYERRFWESVRFLLPLAIVGEGRSGKSCERRSEEVEVGLEARLGEKALPELTTGDPTRRGSGTGSRDPFRSITGDATCSGDGNGRSMLSVPQLDRVCLPPLVMRAGTLVSWKWSCSAVITGANSRAPVSSGNDCRLLLCCKCD